MVVSENRLGAIQTASRRSFELQHNARTSQGFASQQGWALRTKESGFCS